jgi:hypothetical protein
MDDAVVWADYHRDEIEKRDRRIRQLENDLEFLTEAHRKLIESLDDKTPWSADGLTD